MQVAPTFFKEYQNEKEKGIVYIYSIEAYLPHEDQETMVLYNPASTKRKVYVSYPECYIEITSPSGGINGHHFNDDKELKEFLHIWSATWGADFWNELKSRQLTDC